MKTGVGIIFENSAGEILLMLRDNKKEIPFPNTWYIPGGVVEEDEEPKEAVVRETMEEFELKLKDFVLFKKYVWADKIEFIYYKRIDFDANMINLHEGQKIEWMNSKKAAKLKLAFNDNKILADFIEFGKQTQNQLLD